jgi:hypothetical protein
VLKISEVYEKQVKDHSERPDGSEYTTFKKVYETRELLLNPDYIVSVRAYDLSASLPSSIADGGFPMGTKFTALVLDGHSFRTSEMIVVGSFEKITQELRDQQA